MRTIVVSVFVGALLTGGAPAMPPGPGQHFDCSNGGDTSCAADDQGCVPSDALALKCSRRAAKVVAKAIKAATGCHAKQADQRFAGTSETGAGAAEENCESNPGNSAQANFDDGIAALTASGCDAGLVAGVAAYGAALFGAGPGSFDGDNQLVYCDSSSGALIGDDDTGWVAADAGMLKCEITVAKALVKLQGYVTRCHMKMALSFTKGSDFAEEECEEVDPTASKGALERFNQVRDKLVALGICPSCLDATAMDALAAATIAREDAENDVAYPCP